jgi:hypothetical protein
MSTFFFGRRGTLMDEQNKPAAASAAFIIRLSNFIDTGFPFFL